MKAASRPSSTRAVMLCRSRRQKQRRINEYGVQRHTEMQVRSGHSPGRADLAEHLAGPHVRAALYTDRAQMAVHGDESSTVIEDHRVAVEEEISGVEHTAIGGGVHRRSGGRCDIHAAVGIARLVVER